MPLLQNFNCAAISKEPRCLILAPHGWTQEGAEPEQKSTEAISLRATSDGVCLAKRGLSEWCKWNSTALLTLDKPGSRGSSRPPPHPGTAGERDINICAESAGFSGAAAAPGSFAAASDVLNGHLWWGESPPPPPFPLRNDFLSERGDWRVVGRHQRCSLKGMEEGVGGKNSGRLCLFMW